MNLRLSYVSEPGDTLSDLGNGRVLIRNPGKQDRVLDRSTGEIVEGPLSEWHRMGEHVLKTLGLTLLLSAALIYYMLR